MRQIAIEQLEADRFYWARRKPIHGLPLAEAFDMEIIRISTVFGSSPEFWAVAVTGTDEHFDIEAYDFFHKVASPSTNTERAPLKLVGSRGKFSGAGRLD